MNQVPSEELPKTPVLVMILLTLLTLGLYIPWWFWSRESALHRLNTAVRLGRSLILVLFSLIVFNSLLESRAWVEWFQLEDQLPQWKQGLSLTINVVVLFLSFRVRAMLVDHTRQPRSFLWTFLFQIFYLQHVINKTDFSTSFQNPGDLP